MMAALLLIYLWLIGWPVYTHANQEDRNSTRTAIVSDGWVPPYFKPYIIYPAVSIAGSIGVGDFNNDGRLDVVESNSDFFIGDYQINVFLQNTSGTLGSPTTYEAGYRPESLATGDLNNDSRDDIVVANAWENTISVFLQLPNGTMSSQVKYMTRPDNNPF
ncbi:MAG: VCBS repeat-containing protein [Chloroflexi bacterium]|nr:VCBS repeat-containing protein [Chloroflexota bacterium]